jgi:hypothetical protein
VRPRLAFAEGARMSLATLEDYEARYGPVADEDRGRVETILDDAAALVLRAVGDSEADWATDEGTDPPREVVIVVTGVARRALKHEDGVVREQLGEHGVTYRADSAWEIWLTRQEERIVRKAAELSSVQSVTLVSPYSGDEPTWPELPL